MAETTQVTTGHFVAVHTGQRYFVGEVLKTKAGASGQATDLEIQPVAEVSGGAPSGTIWVGRSSVMNDGSLLLIGDRDDVSRLCIEAKRVLEAERAAAAEVRASRDQAWRDAPCPFGGSHEWEQDSLRDTYERMAGFVQCRKCEEVRGGGMGGFQRAHASHNVAPPAALTTTVTHTATTLALLGGNGGVRPPHSRYWAVTEGYCHHTRVTGR